MKVIVPKYSLTTSTDDDKYVAVLEGIQLYPESFSIVECQHDHGLGPILRVHSADYIQYLQTFQESNDNSPVCYPHPKLFKSYPLSLREICTPVFRLPADMAGIKGFYSFDNSVPLTTETYLQAYWSAQAAIDASRALLHEERPVFALCSTPGHHAGKDVGGGYCYLNNAAIAAQYLIDQELHFVTILDIGYHHGNGTQSIFFEEYNPVVIDIHGEGCFPYYTGKDSEHGNSIGTNRTVNISLPDYSTGSVFIAALQRAINLVQTFNTRYLVVSFGATGFVDDPWGKFTLTIEDYKLMGTMLAELAADMKILIVMEDGYHIQSLGEVVTSFLLPFT